MLVLKKPQSLLINVDLNVHRTFRKMARYIDLHLPEQSSALSFTYFSNSVVPKCSRSYQTNNRSFCN